MAKCTRLCLLLHVAVSYWSMLRQQFPNGFQLPRHQMNSCALIGTSFFFKKRDGAFYLKINKHKKGQRGMRFSFLPEGPELARRRKGEKKPQLKLNLSGEDLTASLNFETISSLRGDSLILSRRTVFFCPRFKVIPSFYKKKALGSYRHEELFPPPLFKKQGSLRKKKTLMIIAKSPSNGSRAIQGGPVAAAGLPRQHQYATTAHAMGNFCRQEDNSQPASISPFLPPPNSLVQNSLFFLSKLPSLFISPRPILFC